MYNFMYIFYVHILYTYFIYTFTFMLDKAINIKILKQILILKGHWCVHIFSLSINHMLVIDLRLTIMLSLLLKFLVQFL